MHLLFIRRRFRPRFRGLANRTNETGRSMHGEAECESEKRQPFAPAALLALRSALPREIGAKGIVGRGKGRRPRRCGCFVQVVEGGGGQVVRPSSGVYGLL